MTIDGYTQRGARSASSPGNEVLKIRINGARAGVGANGLELTAYNSKITGLVINRFKANGILVEGDNNTVEGNYIGTDQTGTLDHANGKAGVRISRVHPTPSAAAAIPPTGLSPSPISSPTTWRTVCRSLVLWRRATASSPTGSTTTAASG